MHLTTFRPNIAILCGIAFHGFLFGGGVHAQIDGDNIFSVEQVIDIDLTFPQPDFWTTLQANYEADENEYIPAMLTKRQHVARSIHRRLVGRAVWIELVGYNPQLCNDVAKQMFKIGTQSNK